MKILLTSLLTVGLSIATSDGHKEMFVRDTDAVKHYRLNYFSPTGKTHLKGIANHNLAFFKGDFEEDVFTIKCTKSTHTDDVTINFEVKEESGGLADLFSDNVEEKNDWQVYLNRHKPIDMNLSFGYGKAMLDLNGMTVNKLRVDNVNADIHLLYRKHSGNSTNMDSLILFSEFGQLTLDGPEQSRAKYASIENAYGKTVMNIKGKPRDRFDADLYIGSGQLIVNIPDKKIPMKIVVKEKHLASLTLPEWFEAKEGEIFVNEAYKTSQIDPLIFNIHGSVGEVIFQMTP